MCKVTPNALSGDSTCTLTIEVEGVLQTDLQHARNANPKKNTCFACCKLLSLDSGEPGIAPVASVVVTRFAPSHQQPQLAIKGLLCPQCAGANDLDARIIEYVKAIDFVSNVSASLLEIPRGLDS